jgi:thiol-disulfide isomerase/thioredoxin
MPSRYRTQRVALPRPWWKGPWAWVGGITVVVVAVVVIFIVVGMRPAAKSTAASSSNQLAPASVLDAVTGVSPSVSSTIGAGGVADPLEAISGSPAALTGPGGKPELFYYGAEFCPYCAAERWSVVIALSRFGTFTNLHITMSDSNPNDIPDTHTFTFYGSSYSSPYLDFAAIESADRNNNVLQTPTAAEGTLISTYDTTPYSTQTGGIPFQDLGNRYIVSGSGVNPELLQGMTWQQIAATLTDTSSKVAQPIIGDANWLTAGICKLTGDQPGSVCSAAPIASLEGQIASS